MSGRGGGCLLAAAFLALSPLALAALPMVLLQQTNGAVFESAQAAPGAPMDFHGAPIPVPNGGECGAKPPAAAPRFTLPLPGGPVISSPFGLRADPFGRGFRCHSGLDLAAPVGTPIRAAAGGTVVGAGWVSGYGLLVRIDHGRGIETWYGHQSRLLVRSGDRVEQGQEIGRVGSTGRSTGPHLHFEVRVYGALVDPALVLDWRSADSVEHRSD